MIICDNVIEKISNSHSHLHDEAHINALKVIENMREHSLKSDEATSSVINHCTSDVPLSTCGALPKKDSLARSVRRVRVRASANEDLTVTTRGEIFFYHMSQKVSVLCNN